MGDCDGVSGGVDGVDDDGDGDSDDGGVVVVGGGGVWGGRLSFQNCKVCQDCEVTRAKAHKKYRNYCIMSIQHPYLAMTSCKASKHP